MHAEHALSIGFGTMYQQSSVMKQSASSDRRYCRYWRCWLQCLGFFNITIMKIIIIKLGTYMKNIEKMLFYGILLKNMVEPFIELEVTYLWLNIQSLYPSLSMHEKQIEETIWYRTKPTCVHFQGERGHCDLGIETNLLGDYWGTTALPHKQTFWPKKYMYCFTVLYCTDFINARFQ